MYYKKYAALVMASAMLAGTVAYANEVEEETTVEETTAAEFVGGETVYPVTVINSDGSETVIEEEPQKVISVGPNLTEIMYSIEAEDKLIARTDYCDYPAEVTELPSIGSLYEIDMEALLSMEPDLVLLSTHVSDEDREKLEDAGVAVMYLYEEHDIEGVYTMIDTLGVAVNRQDAAVEVIDEMKEKIADIEEALEDADPVSVYYVVGYGEYGDYTAGGDTFINGILELAGGENIAADVEGWSYSVETLLEKDPEFIILPEYAYDDFIQLEPYSELTAVKEGKVYTIDSNMLDRQCERNADAIEQIASMLHPDLVSLEEEEVETEEETTEAAVDDAA